MGDYFKPWRRKFGVVTLVIACVLMAGWVRSVTIHDVAQCLISDQTQLFIDSSDGVFCCGRFHGHDRGYFPSTYQPIGWSQVEFTQYDRESWGKRKWYWHFYDVWLLGHSSGANPNGQRFEYFFFINTPYWSIVIPLTLLSAWLLLTKPRKPRPKIET